MGPTNPVAGTSPPDCRLFTPAPKKSEATSIDRLNTATPLMNSSSTPLASSFTPLIDPSSASSSTKSPFSPPSPRTVPVPALPIAVPEESATPLTQTAVEEIAIVLVDEHKPKPEPKAEAQETEDDVVQDNATSSSILGPVVAETEEVQTSKNSPPNYEDQAKENEGESRQRGASPVGGKVLGMVSVMSPQEKALMKRAMCWDISLSPVSQKELEEKRHQERANAIAEREKMFGKTAWTVELDSNPKKTSQMMQRLQQRLSTRTFAPTKKPLSSTQPLAKPSRQISAATPKAKPKGQIAKTKAKKTAATGAHSTRAMTTKRVGNSASVTSQSKNSAAGARKAIIVARKAKAISAEGKQC